MSAEANRISLNKGYTKDGFADKVYHIRFRYSGDNDELYFRDYLNEYKLVRKERNKKEREAESSRLYEHS